MILVIAEHNNESLKSFTLNAIQAAFAITKDVDVLVVGNDCINVANEVSSVPHVKNVLNSNSEIYKNHLSEKYPRGDSPTTH